MRETFRSESGLTMIEMVIVVGVAIILLAAAGMAFNNKSAQGNATFTGLQAALDRAYTLAQTSSNGATIVAFQSHATDGTTADGIIVDVCQGRPNGQGMNACAQVSSFPINTTVTPPGGSAISPPWAIYVNTDRSVAVGAWPTSQANTESGNFTAVSIEPSCPAGSAVLVNINYSGFQGTPQLPCSGGAMTRTGF